MGIFTSSNNRRYVDNKQKELDNEIREIEFEIQSFEQKKREIIRENNHQEKLIKFNLV
jgi:hypothetical protein